MLCEGIQTHLAYGQKSKSKHGNLSWMLFMPKVLHSSVKFGMLEGFLILVCI